MTEVKRSHIAAGAALSVRVGLAAATAGYAALRLQRSTRLARRAHPFERQAEPEGARLLVVGDSTAGGAGASDPIHSLPGLLSRANPSLSVVNKAEPGARFADILEQLDGNERFDAVLVLGGTRDVLGTTRDAALRDRVQRVAQRARVRAEVLPLLSELSPGVVSHLNALADALAESEPLEDWRALAQGEDVELGRAHLRAISRARKLGLSGARVRLPGGKEAEVEFDRHGGANIRTRSRAAAHAV